MVKSTYRGLLNLSGTVVLWFYGLSTQSRSYPHDNVPDNTVLSAHSIASKRQVLFFNNRKRKNDQGNVLSSKIQQHNVTHH